MTAASLRGKHAVVTGAGQGIGATIALELGMLGANLTLMGRDLDKLENQRLRLKKYSAGNISCVPCDVTSESKVKNAFETAAKDLGNADILVNNAGAAESAAFASMTRDTWDRMLAVNLTGTFLCTQQVLPAMIEAKSGRIVNIASSAGLKGYAMVSAYCAAKHGVVGLTRSLAAETAKFGITVNAVCPGYTDTDMTKTAVHNLVTALGKTEEEALKMLLRNNPSGKLITPEDVAHTVAWLCSPDSAAITGQAIAIAGGEAV